MGLSASPQLSWMTSDASFTKNDGAIMGFNFGLLTDFFFADRYSLSTGVFINNTGGKLKYNETFSFKTSDSTYVLAPESVVRYRIQYIDVPLAFRMESNPIGYFVYYAQFGVTNQIRVGASADIAAVEVNGVGCKDEVSLFNMGYNVGAGLNYYFSKNTAITVGILYNNGFLDVTSNSGKPKKDKVSLKSFMLRCGILF